MLQKHLIVFILHENTINAVQINLSLTLFDHHRLLHRRGRRFVYNSFAVCRIIEPVTLFVLVMQF